MRLEDHADDALRVFARQYAANSRSPLTGTPCCYGRCPLTMAGHESVPPPEGSRHEYIWRLQRRHL